MVPRSEVTAPIRRRDRVIRRRRQNFERMLGVAGLTLLLGFVPQLRWMWFVHLGVLGALGFYVTRLLKYKREKLEREHKVTTLQGEEPPAQQVSSL